jgi:hypothetical protein
MTQVGPASATAVRTSAVAGTSFVEWSAVFAGAVTAAALSFVFLTFGSAIGLSAASPWPNSGLSSKTLASLAVFWIMAQQIGALIVGGYVAGRLRTRWAEASPDEVEFRDGLHGALVWAVGTVIGAVLFFSTAGAVARTGTEVATKAASVVAASSTDSMTYYTDVLLRPIARTAATGQAASRSEMIPQEARAELTRVMTRAVANGSLADNDRSYLASVISQRTGLPQAEAERRVTETFAEANRIAREAADKTRRAALLTGFVTAASLLISLAAAWWAAQRGGNHRDNAIPARFTFIPSRRTP